MLTKNYLAKPYGIITGEAVWAAMDKCPGLVVVKPRFELYMRYSKQVKRIFRDYTDKIESFGIDEAWLDVTHSMQLYGSPEQIARTIMNRIRQELGLTLSIGIANNKIYAKLGSDLAGQDEYICLYNSAKEKLVYCLPVESLLYVGKATCRKMHSLNIRTIGDLAESDLEYIKKVFGKNGEVLWIFANGYDNSEVAVEDFHPTVKSVGNSTTTIRDLCSLDDVLITFTVLADSVASRLREQGFYASCISISVRTNNLQWSGVQTTLKNPTDLAHSILETAMDLFRKNYSLDIPLRSLGIKASKLSNSRGYDQFSLFEENVPYDNKAKQLESSIDEIRSRFGYYSITNARLLSDRQLAGFNPKDEHVIHPESYFRK